MRHLAILLLVATAAAEDDAAALFYKGFWLEQAEGKLDEAAALYGQLLSGKPDAAEAPRALLGLVRIKVARGEDPRELVAELLRRYPLAKEEVAAARRFAERGTFDPDREGDTPVARKLRELYVELTHPDPAQLSDPDRLFLVDLGSAAHPMLGRLLRATSAGPAETAASVLVSQRTPEAYALLAGALLDDAALFRSAIVKALENSLDAPRVVVEALEKLYDRSPPRLRSEIVATLVRLTLREGDGRDRAFAVLTRVLAEDDQGRRSQASAALDLGDVPDAYVDAVLRRVEAGDKLNVHPLLLYADRPAFRERIEKALEGVTLVSGYVPAPLSEEAARLLARKVVRDLEAGSRDMGVFQVAIRVAQESPSAAGALLTAALALDDENLAAFIRQGLDKRDARRYLGAGADKLRAAALAKAPGVHEEGGRAVREVLGLVDIRPEDYPSVVEALRRRGDRGLPAVLLERKHLFAFGAEKAGALVEFCRDERAADGLLDAGIRFAKEEDSGVAFFREVVPRVGPASARQLHELMGYPALSPIVARKLLEANEPAWGWHTGAEARGWHWPNDGGKHAGPYVWSRIDGQQYRTPPLRDLLLPFVEDPRYEIAIAATLAAAADQSEAGTEALRRALKSKPQARRIALEELVRRVPDGAAVLREFATRPDVAGEDYISVEVTLPGLEPAAAAAVVRDLLGQKREEWAHLWHSYRELAPKECVELALAEATGGGSPVHREEAVRVLTEVDDPRRIEVFRAVLQGREPRAIRMVLQAVGDQYLVELGAEALSQLRNPDEGIRELATKAIDRLKFYAEARKAFDR